MIAPLAISVTVIDCVLDAVFNVDTKGMYACVAGSKGIVGGQVVIAARSELVMRTVPVYPVANIVVGVERSDDRKYVGSARNGRTLVSGHRKMWLPARVRFRHLSERKP